MAERPASWRDCRCGCSGDVERRTDSGSGQALTGHVLQVFPFLSCVTFTKTASCGRRVNVAHASGAARRRRERRLWAWLRLERMTVAIVLADVNAPGQDPRGPGMARTRESDTDLVPSVTTEGDEAVSVEQVADDPMQVVEDIVEREMLENIAEAIQLVPQEHSHQRIVEEREPLGSWKIGWIWTTSPPTRHRSTSQSAESSTASMSQRLSSRNEWWTT